MPSPGRVGSTVATRDVHFPAGGVLALDALTPVLRPRAFFGARHAFYDLLAPEPGAPGMPLWAWQGTMFEATTDPAMAWESAYDGSRNFVGDPSALAAYRARRRVYEARMRKGTPPPTPPIFPLPPEQWHFRGGIFADHTPTARYSVTGLPVGRLADVFAREHVLCWIAPDVLGSGWNAGVAWQWATVDPEPENDTVRAPWVRGPVGQYALVRRPAEHRERDFTAPAGPWTIRTPWRAREVDGVLRHDPKTGPLMLPAESYQSADPPPGVASFVASGAFPVAPYV